MSGQGVVMREVVSELAFAAIREGDGNARWVFEQTTRFDAALDSLLAELGTLRDGLERIERLDGAIESFDGDTIHEALIDASVIARQTLGEQT